ncbi:MAG: NAD-binding protein [Deltaproteobacteria bacterium]|nr:NAD-binding protein [Deltaproteobacteria bacterium]
MGKRRRLATRSAWVYACVLVREFRWTLVVLGIALALGTTLYGVTPIAALGGRPASLFTSLYGAWTALLGEPLFSPPETWYLAFMNGFYPLVGIALIGEGIVRFGLLMFSRRQGEKEWMKAMAKAVRDHIILCGIGHLGFRILERLVQNKLDVVVIERDSSCRFLAQAKATGVPILIQDMKDDQTLVEAGITRARAIVVATNDDIANLEVALDAKRMNPAIRVIMRLFDQQIAAKIKDAFCIDEAFSASAVAAPVVAAMALGTRVLSSYEIDGVPHVTAEVDVHQGSPLVGKTVGAVERSGSIRVLSKKGGGASGPAAPVLPDTLLCVGDMLVVHATADELGAVAIGGGAG